MAHYSWVHLRYRGRLVRITTRYGSPMSAQVMQGKPLDIGPLDDWKPNRDAKRLLRLFDREQRRNPEYGEFPY